MRRPVHCHHGHHARDHRRGATARDHRRADDARRHQDRRPAQRPHPPVHRALAVRVRRHGEPRRRPRRLPARRPRRVRAHPGRAHAAACPTARATGSPTRSPTCSPTRGSRSCSSSPASATPSASTGPPRSSTTPSCSRTARSTARCRRSGILVTIEEAYTQCPKAMIRSELWNPEHHIDRSRAALSRRDLPLAQRSRLRRRRVRPGARGALQAPRGPATELGLLDVHPGDEPDAQLIDVDDGPGGHHPPARSRTSCCTSTATRPSSRRPISTGRREDRSPPIGVSSSRVRPPARPAGLPPSRWASRRPRSSRPAPRRYRAR